MIDEQDLLRTAFAEFGRIWRFGRVVQQTNR
jgi:hypothetical protein